MSDWLNELKAGDEVIVRGTGYRNQSQVGRVAKRDKVKVVVALRHGEARFSARNGYSFSGDSWNRSYLAEATPDLLAKTRDENRREWLIDRIKKALPFDKHSTATLEQIVALLEDAADV